MTAADHTGSLSAGQRQIVFHVGPPKTATTTFQHMLKANAARLAPGIAVLARDKLCSRVRSNAAKLAEGGPLRRLRLRLAVWRLARKLLARAEPVIILSDENLLGFSTLTLFDPRGTLTPLHVIDLLERALPTFDRRYVAYERPAEAWRGSCHAQAVKWAGAVEDAEAWALRFPDTGQARRSLQVLADHIGPRFEIIDMAAEVQRDGFAGRRVLELAGLDAATIDSLDRVHPKNLANSRASEEFMLAVNALGLSKSARRKVASCVCDHQELFAGGDHG